MIYTSRYQSPLGELLLAAQDGFLIGLWIAGQKYYLDKVTEVMAEGDDYPVLRQAKAWLDRYFAGECPAPGELPLAPLGSDFQRQVCQLMCAIPYGEVRTYGELAAQVAARLGRQRMSAQAVGGAVGHNSIAIIIPCHRVVGAKGNLTGYAGGMEKKTWLLKHEGVDMQGFYVSGKGTAL